jgi:hypothetical protein
MAKSGDTQIDLFTTETPYVAEWVKARSTAFDPKLAAKWKREGMQRAAGSHPELLAQVKLALIQIARGRESRCVTADDAQAWLIAHGYSPASLGNAAGSLFRGDDFVLVSYRPSERASRHGNRGGVWRLKDGK